LTQGQGFGLRIGSLHDLQVGLGVSVDNDGEQTLQLKDEDLNTGLITFPPPSDLVAVTLVASSLRELVVVGIVTNKAARVEVHLGDQRTIEAKLLTLPPSITDSYSWFGKCECSS
jgi:hypothetical protein